MMGRAGLFAAVLAPLLGLSACGLLGNSGGGLVGQVVGGLLPGDDGAPGTPAQPLQRPGYTAAEVAADPDNYILFTVNALGISEPGRLVATAGANQTFEAESGFTAAYQDGMLVSTHGLAFDLIASDGTQTRAALRAGGGEVNRAIEVMDSLDQLSRFDFRCTVVSQGDEAVNLGTREATLRKFSENCTSSALAFENLYWLDGAGNIIASREYVSPTVAYLRSNRL